MDNISLTVDQDAIRLEIPLQAVSMSQQTRWDMQFIINNPERMKKWLLENMLSASEENAPESFFEQFINRLLQYAYEDGQAWIDGLVPE